MRTYINLLAAALATLFLRHVLFQAALVASHHNRVLKTFVDCLRAAGKPHKVVITAVARKLTTIANALVKSGQKWSAQPI